MAQEAGRVRLPTRGAPLSTGRSSGAGRRRGGQGGDGPLRREARRQGGRVRSRDAGGEADGTQRGDTRERILDVALDLFTELGFEKTSLRQIAERMGFSKAALYYHFASKDDILMALHMRLHRLGFGAMAELRAEEPGSVEQRRELWYRLLDGMVGNILGNRRLFAFHERNRAALERLHSDRHEEGHDDLEELFHGFLGDAQLPTEQRVRLGSAVGALFGNLFLVGEAFAGVPADELAAALRSVLRDILQVDADGRSRSPADLAGAAPPAAKP